MTVARRGLRERSKTRRRRDIQLAALRLFAERGYDGATLADIAAAADVAPRTVSLYFPAKADLALGHSSEVAQRLSSTFLAHPGADFVDILDRWLEAEEQARDPVLARASAAMFAVNPQLRALSSRPITVVVDHAREALCAELGMEPADPLARIITAALAAAVVEYLAVTTAEAAPAALRSEVAHRLIPAILDAGRPRPAAPRPQRSIARRRQRTDPPRDA